MQITLAQADIESALKMYVSNMGLTQPVKEITFSQTRKGGHSIAAEINLADNPVPTEQPAANSVAAVSSESVSSEPITEAEEVDTQVDRADTPLFGL